MSIDHCSSLNCDLPQVRLQPLVGVLRVAVRIIGGVPKFGHISDFMRDTLHWLPVRQCIPPLFGIVSLALRLLTWLRTPFAVKYFLRTL